MSERDKDAEEYFSEDAIRERAREEEYDRRSWACGKHRTENPYISTAHETGEYIRRTLGSDMYRKYVQALEETRVGELDMIRKLVPKIDKLAKEGLEVWEIADILKEEDHFPYSQIWVYDRMPKWWRGRSWQLGAKKL